jgi:hypothetical protein
METSIVWLLFMAIALACVVLIPALIGVYVYRDAKSRNMDAVLWTLVAILIPSFIGLIIYLVIRTNNTNLNCPQCQKPVAPEYALCPYCGMSLKATCPICAAPVDGGWKLCPKCGTELPQQTSTETYVAPKKDKKLVRILVIAILAPILLLTVALGSLFALRGETQTTLAGTNMSVEDEKEFLHPAVLDWIADCDKDGKGVYVLKLTPASDAAFIQDKLGDDIDKSYFAYVYINTYKGEENYKGFFGHVNFARNKITIQYNTLDTAEEKIMDYELSQIGSHGVNIKSLTIEIDGKQVDYKLTEMD